jgi:hypothetical protein
MIARLQKCSIKLPGFMPGSLFFDKEKIMNKTVYQTMSTVENFNLLKCNVSKNVERFLHNVTSGHDSLSQGNLLNCLSRKNSISMFENSKPGESRGRKATGLK